MTKRSTRHPSVGAAVAELAASAAVVQAVNVLRDKGINGVMYEKLIDQIRGK